MIKYFNVWFFCRSEEVPRRDFGKTNAVPVPHVPAVSLQSGAPSRPRATAVLGARRRRGLGPPALHLPTPPPKASKKILVIRSC